MIKPLADRIVVKEEKQKDEEVNSFGIVIPKSAKNMRHKEGKVVAVGRGRLAEPTSTDVAGMNASHFAFYPMEVKVGDRVLFTFGDDYSFAGEEYKIIKESDILAIIE